MMETEWRKHKKEKIKILSYEKWMKKCIKKVFVAFSFSSLVSRDLMRAFWCFHMRIKLLEVFMLTTGICNCRFLFTFSDYAMRADRMHLKEAFHEKSSMRVSWMPKSYMLWFILKNFLNFIVYWTTI